MFAFLSVAGLLLASASPERPSRMLLAGLLLLAAVGTRPDGVIFAAVAVAGVWLVNQNASLRARLALAAPLILGGAVLAAFKLLCRRSTLTTRKGCSMSIFPSRRTGSSALSSSG